MTITIIQLIGTIIGTVLTILGLIISLAITVWKFKTARTQEGKTAAIVDMMNQAKIIIEEVEGTYGASSALKSVGINSSLVKKDSAMTKLQSYAISKGYDFNINNWSEIIDKFVALTKKVNSSDASATLDKGQGISSDIAMGRAMQTVTGSTSIGIS